MPTNTPSSGAPSSASGVGGKAAIGLVCLVVGLVVGYGAGRVSTGTPVNPLLPSGDGGPAGTPTTNDAAPLPPPPAETTTLNGTAVASSATQLTLDADIAFYDPDGSRKLPVRRTVNIGAETEIYLLVERTPEEMAAASAAHEAALESASPEDLPPPPPSPLKSTRISAADIKPGDLVTVDAAADVLASATFDAVRITVMAKQEPAQEPAAPAPLPEAESQPATP